MSVLEALHRLVVDLEEAEGPDGEVNARGTMRFDAALRGPPGRVHGGYHACARTLSILERLKAHEGAATFPCELDLTLQRALPLEEPVPFEATYRRSPEDGRWELRSRLLGTDRLLAKARSIGGAPLLDEGERARWRTLHDEGRSQAVQFGSFGFEINHAPRALWAEIEEPRRTAPASQHAALVDDAGVFGPAFVCTQLDFVGAVARARETEHPHFTKHIHLCLAVETIPADAHLICIADRTTMEADPDSETPPIEIAGRSLGTMRVRVALFDAAFEHVYGTGTITVHPVDPSKFPALANAQAPRAQS